MYLMHYYFCIANIGFEMGGVFLNAYLPEIALRKKLEEYLVMVGLSDMLVV